MHHPIAIVVLSLLGVSLALDAGGVLSAVLVFIATNPLTVAFESVAPESIFAIDAALQSLAPLSVPACLSGALISLVFARANRGVTFWFGYAIGRACKICVFQISGFGVGSVIEVLPLAVGACCTIPGYVVGVQLTQICSRRKRITFSIFDLLLLTGIIAALSSVSVYMSAWYPAIAFFVIPAGLYLRLRTVVGANGEPIRI